MNKEKSLKNKLIASFVVVLFVIVALVTLAPYDLSKVVWAYINDYNKSAGDVVTEEMWNNLDNDFGNLLPASCATWQVMKYNGSSWVCAGDSNDGAMPAKAISAFYTTTCPTGWRAADGTNSTPDLRGKFLRGINNFGTGTLTGGRSDPDGSRSLGSYQDDLLESHRHLTRLDNNTAGFGAGDDNDNQSGFSSWSAYTGGNETRPKNVGVIYCVKN